MPFPSRADRAEGEQGSVALCFVLGRKQKAISRLGKGQDFSISWFSIWSVEVGWTSQPLTTNMISVKKEKLVFAVSVGPWADSSSHGQEEAASNIS